MRFKIATFNLFNMALPEIEYYKNMKYSHEDYEKKINWTGGQLAAMNADIVAFQEVFHKKALEAAVTKSGSYSGFTPIMLDEVGDKPRVGLVTRLPVLSAESILDFPADCKIDAPGFSVPLTQFRRPLLKVTVKLPNDTTAVVFALHLKSKNPMMEDESKRFNFLEMAKGEVMANIQRSLEALAIRSLVLKETERTKTPVIVMGDMNDSGSSVTTEIIKGKPPQHYYPQDVKIKIWDTLLYSVSDIQIKKGFRDVNYTHMHNNQYESLDHILISEEFVIENPKHIGIVEYVRYFNDHLFENYSIEDAQAMTWQSDHGQVLASIRLC